jgi:ketosteroid isomerase-like protein
MSAKNVKTLRAAHESWNKRDFAGIISNAAVGLTYTDHARTLTMNTRDKFREWTEAWAKAFSDGRITNPQYIDAGDTVIAQFTAEGTNGKCHCRFAKSAISTRKDESCRAAAITINTHC